VCSGPHFLMMWARSKKRGDRVVDKRLTDSLTEFCDLLDEHGAQIEVCIDDEDLTVYVNLDKGPYCEIVNTKIGPTVPITSSDIWKALPKK